MASNPVTITFYDKAVRAYEASIADVVKAEDDARRRNFDSHMAQFLHKLKAMHILEHMPQGWKPLDYDVTVDGVRLVFEPQPSQSVVVPLVCEKCKTVIRKQQVTSMESLGRILIEFYTAKKLCVKCAPKEKVEKEREWSDMIADGIWKVVGKIIEERETSRIDGK